MARTQLTLLPAYKIHVCLALRTYANSPHTVIKLPFRTSSESESGNRYAAHLGALFFTVLISFFVSLSSFPSSFLVYKLNTNIKVSVPAQPSNYNLGSTRYLSMCQPLGTTISLFKFLHCTPLWSLSTDQQWNIQQCTFTGTTHMLRCLAVLGSAWNSHVKGHLQKSALQRSLGTLFI